MVRIEYRPAVVLMARHDAADEPALGAAVIVRGPAGTHAGTVAPPEGDSVDCWADVPGVEITPALAEALAEAARMGAAGHSGTVWVVHG